MSDDGPDEGEWAGVKHDFLYSGKSVEVIAEERGIAPTTLRRRIKSFGWVRVVPTKRTRRKWRGPGHAFTGPQGEELHRQRIIARLFKLLDRKLELLEARMAETERQGGERTAADSERDSRELAAILQTVTRLAAVDEKLNKGGKGSGPDTAKGMSDDADEFRRDLADRLARLRKGEDV
ncbi:MAG: hypothetical protein ACRECX_14880 [Methyloceanibacter sp.]|uniref:hypothetical protein n=1 Tax=Methyloceanibacter sp. TaxID=1965321 RepID=UPI003D6C9838